MRLEEVKIPCPIVPASAVDLLEARVITSHFILLFPVVCAPHLRTIFKVFKDIAPWVAAWGTEYWTLWALRWGRDSGPVL